jgi:hypothetical protein
MASTVTETYVDRGPIGCVSLAVTAHTDGSVTDYVLTTKISGRLLALETNPGGTAPQANYDIVINDAEGHDVLQGLGANRHTSTTEKVAIVYTGTAIHPPVSKGDTLTLGISGNNVNGALTLIKLYYEGAAGS